jgi:EpsI family protein
MEGFVANVERISSPSKALWIGAGLMLAALGLAYALVPRTYTADEKPPMRLEQVVPSQFGQWRVDDSIKPVVADPTLQATLDTYYSQTLARTYVDPQGHRVMLSVAYGKNQNSESTAAHRPEFCYTAQGFSMKNLGSHTISLDGVNQIPVAQLVGTLGARVEPITYWVTLENTPALPGLSRKLQQLRFGLQGKIADGLLVRVSSIGASPQEEYQLHQRFLADWRNATPDSFKPRFFGS